MLLTHPFTICIDVNESMTIIKNEFHIYHLEENVRIYTVCTVKITKIYKLHGFNKNVNLSHLWNEQHAQLLYTGRKLGKLESLCYVRVTFPPLSFHYMHYTGCERLKTKKDIVTQEYKTLSSSLRDHHGTYTWINI